MKFSFLILSFAFLAATPGRAAWVANTGDVAEVDSLPPIGKWMIDSKGIVAHWLNHEYEGKTLDEPVNVIIRVESDSAETAEQKLLIATDLAGFPLRAGHSTGYRAYIGGELASQYPLESKVAFSDVFYFFPNNHGRIFGPVSWNGRYYFTAAFSREDSLLLQKAESYLTGKYVLLHPYSSFNSARDRFVEQMCLLGRATFAGKVDLQNRISDSSEETTGDHDGFAALLDL